MFAGGEQARHGREGDEAAWRRRPRLSLLPRAEPLADPRQAARRLQLKAWVRRVRGTQLL